MHISQNPAFSITSKKVFPDTEKSWLPAITYHFIFASFNFLNSWKVSFKVSIGGNAESNKSPANNIKSTFSSMQLFIAYLKYSVFSWSNSGCLQPPKWQSVICPNLILSLHQIRIFWFYKNSCDEVFCPSQWLLIKFKKSGRFFNFQKINDFLTHSKPSVLKTFGFYKPKI